MNSSDDIEKRLQGTHLPTYTNRLHRDTLKQALLAEFEKENRMAEKTEMANGNSPTTPFSSTRRRLRPRLLISLGAIAASVVAIVIVLQMSNRDAEKQRSSLHGLSGGTSLHSVPDATEWPEGSIIAGYRVDLSNSFGGARQDPSQNRDLNVNNVVTGLMPAGSLTPDSKQINRKMGGMDAGDAGKLRSRLRPTDQEGVFLHDFVAPESKLGDGIALARPQPLAAPQWPPVQPEPESADNYAPIIDNPFHKPAQTPLSTFSIDVDTASYTNVRRFLIQENRLPPKDAIRIEEMVNFFDYSDPAPKDGKPVAINTEVGPCPWNAKHRLVRIGLRATSIDPEQAPARNLVFLVDTSGSMNAPDRLPLLKKGLAMLVETLRPMDRVAIVAYAGSAGLVLPSLPGTEKKQILEAIDRLESGGSTNGGQGIELAYGIAMANIIPKGVNRVILGTDGDFNVGVTSQGELVRLIEEKRKSGVFLSVLGFGHGNLKDGTMEQLAHHGNGHYAYIDTIEEARRLFVEQGAALQVVAGDVKVQVEFNPARVAAYRLVGYENRLMKDQDFNDDKKDAGDMGSGHSVTAIYEVVPAGGKVEVPAVDPLRYQEPAKLAAAANNGELMVVKVRYKEPGEEKSKLIQQPVTDDDRVLAKTSDDFRFAAAVTEFALLLRDSPNKGTASYDDVLRLARGAFGRDLHGHRAAFVQLVQTAQRLSRVE